MRKTLEVSPLGYTETGISLVDRNGIQYNWPTKSRLSPLLYASRGEWFTVTATVYKTTNLNRNVIKNVRIIKER